MALDNEQLDQSFIEKYNKTQEGMKDRMSDYVSAWISGDLDKVLSYFSDSNLDYSDYG